MRLPRGRLDDAVEAVSTFSSLVSWPDWDASASGGRFGGEELELVCQLKTKCVTVLLLIP